jgi:hypothetical protein
MGDNIYLGDRNGVRTPMQWSPDRNAGFSRADPQRLYLQPIMDPMYGFAALNVEAQSRDASSLLSWTKRMLAVRKTSHAFGRGRRNFIQPGNRKILAYLSEYEDDIILTVFNLSRAAQPVELDLSAYRGRVPVEMLGRTAFPPIGELPYLLTLPSYGFYWFRLSVDTAAPVWHQEGIAPHDRPTLVPSMAGRASSASASCHVGSAWPSACAPSWRPIPCRASSRSSAGMQPRARRSCAPASSTMRSGTPTDRAGCCRSSRSRVRQGRRRISCRSPSAGRSRTRSG